MAAFATHQDLAARLGVTLTAEEQARASNLIEMATGLIQAETGQTISYVENDTLTVRGTREGSYLLPQRPVVSVASVTIDGVAAAADTWWLEDEVLVRRGGFGSGRRPLVIVYSHGYEPVPDAIRAVCLEAVVRAWVNPGSVVSERVGSESTTFLQQGTPTGLLLTDAEKQTVRRVTRRGARSEALR